MNTAQKTAIPRAFDFLASGYMKENDTTSFQITQELDGSIILWAMHRSKAYELNRVKIDKSGEIYRAASDWRKAQNV